MPILNIIITHLLEYHSYSLLGTFLLHDPRFTIQCPHNSLLIFFLRFSHLHIQNLHQSPATLEDFISLLLSGRLSLFREKIISCPEVKSEENEGGLLWSKVVGNPFSYSPSHKI